MSNDRMALMEFLVLLIAQTTAMLLKIKFRKGGVFMSSLGVPAFWTVDALISDDWVALDDEPGGSGEADSNVENKDCRAPAVWYEI
ncbi:hypothetical protein HY772_00515 [Candidatus Woesearchaeota archaeon]|nr:hypothetical protein [Candidatus Woesearchaeota archaeon]